jgi:hypothetical protein
MKNLGAWIMEKRKKRLPGKRAFKNLIKSFGYDSFFMQGKEYNLQDKEEFISDFSEHLADFVRGIK